jgi:hypothetical protein
MDGRYTLETVARFTDAGNAVPLLDVTSAIL